MRVMFAARAIGGVAGGVERMLTTIMNALAARGHEVSLLTWDRAGASAFYPMSGDIEWDRLNLGDPEVKAGTALMLERGRTIREKVRLRRPEAIVCFQDGPFVSMLLYTAGLGVPVIAAERNAPTRFEHTRARKYKSVVLQSFRFAKRIIVQCESYCHQYPAFLANRITTIPNPVFPACAIAQPAKPAPDGRYSLISVGRLSYQKNYSALVSAFSSVSSAYPDWDLTIIGDGEDRERLSTMVAELGQTERIRFPGTSNAVEKLYAQAHGFVLPSRWEGFPNALAEAMAHGLPSAGYADCAGVRDLIADRRNGLLASGNGDVAGLAHTLTEIMSNPDLRVELGTSAAESMRAFSPDRIFDLWERVLNAARRG